MLKQNDLLFKKITETIADTDYTGYTIQYPPLFAWRRDFSGSEILRAWKEAAGGGLKHFGIYAHFPYCKKRCTYCRYFSVRLKKKKDAQDYLSALKKEMDLYRKLFSGTKVRSLYLGGGTPALLSIDQLDDLFGSFHKKFDFSGCEQVTFEGNPDFLEPEKIKVLKKWGVNRLTIGVQSLDEKVIKKINRYQTKDSFLKCFDAARKAGIENINVDLMVGLPSQSQESAKNTLKSVVSLRPDMIHVHPFYPTRLTSYMQRGGILSKKAMEKRERVAGDCQKMAREGGYKPVLYDAYGLRPGSRNIQLSDAIEHNSPFLGLGSGAASHATGHIRYINTNDIDKYIRSVNAGTLPVFSARKLTAKDEMIYFVTACLRYGFVDKKKFQRLFGKKLDKIFSNEIKYLQGRRKLRNAPGYLYSDMNNMGEYAIYSKYFYDTQLVQDYKKQFPGSYKKTNAGSLKYMLL